MGLEDNDILDKVDAPIKIPTWLIIAKAIREALPVIVALVIVYFGFRTYFSSNLASLDEDIKESREIIDGQRDSIESLSNIVDSYNSKRFTIHRIETRVLFDDVYFYFNAFQYVYSITKFRTPIVEKHEIPSERPDSFYVNEKQYFIIAERIYRAKDSQFPDSAIIYWDSVNTH